LLLKFGFRPDFGRRWGSLLEDLKDSLPFLDCIGELGGCFIEILKGILKEGMTRFLSLEMETIG